jgi:hypothetical protein
VAQVTDATVKWMAEWADEAHVSGLIVALSGVSAAYYTDRKPMICVPCGST